MDFLFGMDQPACKQLLPTETNRYVSVFRIDGVPILPPLMTNEKSTQMRKLKEKALELERKWEERRRDQSNISKQAIHEASAEVQKPQLPSEELTSAPSCNTNVSECYDDTLSFEPNSYLMLSSIMNSGQERKETMDSSTCTLSADVHGNEFTRDQFLDKRMQKLQKSETLIYDNCSNTIIMNKPEEDLPQQKPQRCQNNNFKKLLDNANNVYRTLGQKIPIICVDPPTPLGSQGFGDTLSISESFENISLRDLGKPSFDDESTDESGHNEGSPKALKAHKKVTNITAKIIQFESLQDDADNNNEYFETPQYITQDMRSATSPLLKRPQLTPTHAMFNSRITAIGDHVQAPLARSNSFTLDCPSKALIDHIHQLKNSQGAAAQKLGAKRSYYPSDSATRDTIESKAKRVQKVEVKPRPQAMRAATKSSSYQSANSCKLRSPYEPKSNRAKIIRPLKTTTATTPSTSGSVGVRPNKSKCSLTGQQSSRNNVAAAPTFKVPQPEIFSEIEAEHRQKFLKLVAQQHEEQKRLQQSFEEQQKLLLDQLAVSMNKMQLRKINTLSMMAPPATTSLENSLIPTSENSEFPMKSSPSSSFNSSAISSVLCDITPSAEELPVSGSSRRLCTPRRRLFSNDSGGSAAVCGENTSTPTSASTAANKRSQQRQQHLENQRRAEAATIICAYARGFLTRRLFQTEQIQRIVQTIRDTLIFVLNLHMESIECPEESNTPANIKLKARLLQQLSSASRTLHLMFFQTSIKDRMDIIARDRKRIKSKLLNIKGSPRIAA